MRSKRHRICQNMFIISIQLNKVRHLNILVLLIQFTCNKTITYLSVHKPVLEPIHDLVHEPAQESEVEDENWQRAKRDHNDDYHGNSNHGGITGPVHTFVKTDKNANYKWGVRHHVGPKYV